MRATRFCIVFFVGFSDAIDAGRTLLVESDSSVDCACLGSAALRRVVAAALKRVVAAADVGGKAALERAAGAGAVADGGAGGRVVMLPRSAA